MDKLTKTTLGAALELLKSLAKGDITGKFEMGRIVWENGCPSCLAGWIFSAYRKNEDYPYLKIPLHASLVDVAHLLKLNDLQANDLFVPEFPNAVWNSKKGSEEYITLNQAIATLSHFIETGKVNWSIEPWKPEMKND